MADTRTCEVCAQREAEFEIRKVTDRPGASFNRALCRTCLSVALADDTASILRISKSGEDEEGAPPAKG